MKTSGNTILITGGTSGIGLGLARKFHEQGNQVIIAGRRTELLDRIAANLLGTIRMVYAFLQLLTGRSDAAVINVSSALAFVPFPITPTYNATKAALHSFSETLRVQVADAGVQVIELVPPGVRTTLMGQQDSEDAMPLEDFLSEAMNLLAAEPDAKEIVVDRARFIRDAQANGNYDDVLAMFTSAAAGR